MTEQEINIAIAETCPGVFIKDIAGLWHCRSGYLCRNGLICHDLNAMHEAIINRIRCKGVYGTPLDKSAEMVFQEHLDAISEREQIPEFLFSADLYAEAFLRTIGKWKE